MTRSSLPARLGRTKAALFGNINFMAKRHIRLVFLFILLGSLLSGCFQPSPGVGPRASETTPTPSSEQVILPTPLPTRPVYSPGELVDYTCQTGDNLPALAARFNTTVIEIKNANPVLPKDVTTLPPGLPLKIPIYYRVLWGTSYQIIPDGLFVYGPAQIDFDAISFVNSMPGWFKDYRIWGSGRWLKGGEFVNYISENNSISPRLLLAMIEYQTGALTQPTMTVPEESPMGLNDSEHPGWVGEMLYIANLLNNGYYGWRIGNKISFEHNDGRLEFPDPWQNAGTVALQSYYASIFDQNDYVLAVSGEGLAKTYAELFGDPWAVESDHIPGSLQQPAMALPFSAGYIWAFTGGPHSAWGTGEPLAAIDFAPPNVEGGCVKADQWATAVADGVVARSGKAQVVLDLDGDMDEHTGWTVFYLHLANSSIPPAGTVLKKGDPIGMPSCEGGRATGTHVHIARMYNGEWIPAEGVLAFNLGGWIAYNGNTEYQGELRRFGRVVIANEKSDFISHIQAGQ